MIVVRIYLAGISCELGIADIKLNTPAVSGAEVRMHAKEDVDVQ